MTNRGELRKTERCSKVLVDNMTSCLISFVLLNGWNRTKKGFFPTSFKILKRKIRYMEDKKENGEERKKPEEEDIKQSR